MAIEMAGAVYCPISPRDPPQRLKTLIEQTQSHFILIHTMTSKKFQNNNNPTLLFVDLDLLFFDLSSSWDLFEEMNDLHLASVQVDPDSIAYIIFTSGSTGIPKAVC